MKITFATTFLLFESLALEAAEWPPQEPSNTKTFNGRTTETLLLRNSFLRPVFLEADLTHRLQGRDFRLTDVDGKVINDWLA